MSSLSSRRISDSDMCNKENLKRQWNRYIVQGVIYEQQVVREIFSLKGPFELIPGEESSKTSGT